MLDFWSHHGDEPVMATHNAPKHDFAPAWLKIPSQDNPKPSGSKQADPGSEKSRRHSGSSSGKYRHHQSEEDYYPYPPYAHYGYYNGYSIQYGSQSSMFRSPGRDPKYQQHPGLRYNQMNGYPGYYDLYPFDYYGDPYYTGYPATRATSKRSHYERDGRSNSKEGKEAEKTKGKETEEKEKASFQDDFPSLNGEESMEKGSNSAKITNGGSVWEHPPHGKMASRFGDRATVNMYKALVPNKGNMKKPSKDGIRFNGGFPKDPFSGNKSPLSPTNSIGQNKDGSRQSPTPPIDILNTRLVTQPRNLGDKKSDFWKALRKGSSAVDGNGDEQKAYADGNVEKLSNGVEMLDFSDADNGLSSSLEAEQRLLKEMGWNEADEEEYEITEDEKKKFQERFSKQVPQQKEANRMLHNKALSPKHIMYYRPSEQEQLNDTLSDSDSEEESSH